MLPGNAQYGPCGGFGPLNVRTQPPEPHHAFAPPFHAQIWPTGHTTGRDTAQSIPKKFNQRPASVGSTTHVSP